MDDFRFMKMALEEAERAFSRQEVPVGAVVVLPNGQVIAKAHNLTETLHDVTAHAEMQAITAATDSIGGKYLNLCTMYVTVEPCAMCAAAMGWAQLGRLVYAASDLQKGYRKLAPGVLHPKTKVSEGVMADEAVALMKEFFRKKRRDS